jgi:hypothetical protein
MLNIIRFQCLEDLLRRRAPESIAQAESLKLAVVDPASADAECCWSVIWNKPLFSATRTELGERNVGRLAPLLNGAWADIGIPDGRYHISLLCRRRSFKPEDYLVRGALAQNIRNNFNIAVHRMFAVQGGAVALRCWAAANPATPCAALTTVRLPALVPQLQATLGPFWGPITVMHLLTDLGLSCKPDRHLFRSVQALWIDSKPPPGMPPTLDNLMRINAAVEALAVSLYGASSPARLRYLDKVLMEISRMSLLEAPECAA